MLKMPHKKSVWGHLRKVRLALRSKGEGRTRKLVLWERRYVSCWLPPLQKCSLSSSSVLSFPHSHAGSQKRQGFQFLLRSFGAVRQSAEKMRTPECCGIRQASTVSVGMSISGQSIPSVSLQVRTPLRHHHGSKGTVSQTSEDRQNRALSFIPSCLNMKSGSGTHSYRQEVGVGLIGYEKMKKRE